MYGVRHSGKTLQLATRWDSSFLCVFELYIFTCFNVWCMCIPTLLFSIELPGWAWIIHSFFIFSQHEHDRVEVEVEVRGKTHLFLSWLAVPFILIQPHWVNEAGWTLSVNSVNIWITLVWLYTFIIVCEVMTQWLRLMCGLSALTRECFSTTSTFNKIFSLFYCLCVCPF